MKCMKKERKRDHTNEEKIRQGRNPSEFEVQREKKMFWGEKKKVFCREKLKRSETNFALDLFK